MKKRFEKIMQFIHFSDNSALDKTDKYTKVVDFLDMLHPLRDLGDHHTTQKRVTDEC